MTKPVLLALIFFTTTVPIFSQTLIYGQVLDQQTNKPVPYANIGILNANVGTISNEDGNFSINIPESFSNDTILFSAIGYSARKIPFSLFKQNQSSTILLPEKATY